MNRWIRCRIQQQHKSVDLMLVCCGIILEGKGPGAVTLLQQGIT